MVVYRFGIRPMSVPTELQPHLSISGASRGYDTPAGLVGYGPTPQLSDIALTLVERYSDREPRNAVRGQLEIPDRSLTAHILVSIHQ